MQDHIQDTRPPLSEVVPIMIEEGHRRALVLALVFSAIAITALLLALAWPRKYFASTSILVSGDNIIQQLMEGRAVATGVVDHALIAKEIVFSKRMMDQLLEKGGFTADSPSAAELARRADDIRRRTIIGSPRENLIQIQYWDTDPRLAQLIAASMGQGLIDESRAAKIEESRDAYDFIAGQVDEYHTRLRQAEQALKDFQEANTYARPSTEADATQRIAALRGQVESARLQLMELSSQERVLAAHLNGQSTTRPQLAMSDNRRLAALQEELDGLLARYTDAHPDVISIRHQMEDIRRQQDIMADQPSPSPVMAFDPVEEKLSLQLSETRSAIAGLQSRLGAMESLLQEALRVGHAVTSSESYLAELTRGYKVNQEIYEDLLARRENARLSMMMDEEGRGLTFRIHEPATLPARPSGLRAVHIASGGVLAATMAPFGLLFLLARFDPRLRSPAALTRQTGLPVIAEVPCYASATTPRGNHIRTAIFIILATLVAYAALLAAPLFLTSP